MQLKRTDAQSAVSQTGAAEQATLPEHLIQLPGGKWNLWRWVCLRGAGFPIKQALTLAAPACAMAADKVLQAERELRLARTRLIEAAERRLDSCEGDLKPRLIRAIISIKRGKIPERLMDGPDLEAPLGQYRLLRSRFDNCRAEYNQSFNASSIDTSRAIQAVIKDSKFQEAVIWQNRSAYHGSVLALMNMLPGDPARAAERRKREDLVANYLQRYCTKNDTIGFFGPVGWARLKPCGEAFIVRPGPRLLSNRDVFFEVWCMDTLADMLAKDERIRAWLAPRRLHFIHIKNTTLYMPSRPPMLLSAGEAAALLACDGNRTADEIASSLIINPETLLDTKERVYRLLEELRERGLISWTLEVPIELNPEQSLRRMLNRIKDDELRTSSLMALSELETARKKVISASGNAERLDQALGDLETAFTRLTGVSPMRSAGKMYAGRTLIYEDCRRDIEVEIGPEIVDSIGPALSLLLTGARWLMFKAMEVHRKTLENIFADLTRRAASRTVDFVTFWYKIFPSLIGGEDEFTKKLASIFQGRWSKILSIPPGKNRVNYTSRELARPVEMAFNAPHSGCKSARFHSPDLMIAASSVDAIRRGDCDFVLGELHVGANTLRFSVFVSQHPSPEELLRAHQADLPEVRAVPLIPKSYWTIKSGRLAPALKSPNEIYLEFGSDPSSNHQAITLPIGSLVIEDSGDGLITRTRDGEYRFDLLETATDIIVNRVVNSFKILSPAQHNPRVTIDRLVVNRESWSLPASEIDLVQETNDAERFIAARRWACKHNMPRFIFVKVPVEVKPFYVDLDSPIYVASFAKAVRRNLKKRPADPIVTITEMLPRPDQAWLPDADGQHYTSELRMVAVDSAL